MSAPMPHAANADDQQSHTQRLIGVEHGALHALAAQLPEVNQLLESSFEEISGTFMQIATDFSSYQRQAEELAIADEAKQALGELSARINGNVGKIVMGMQFQDRVSQNLVITINVLNDLLAEWPEGESTDERELAFAKSVLDKMKLGEFRQRYLDYLLEHQLIDAAESIGFVPGETIDASDDEDDIDLF